MFVRRSYHFVSPESNSGKFCGMKSFWVSCKNPGLMNLLKLKLMGQSCRQKLNYKHSRFLSTISSYKFLEFKPQQKPSLPEVLELLTHLGKCHTAGANSLTHRYVIVRKTDEKESIFNQGYNYTIPMLIGLFSRPQKQKVVFFIKKNINLQENNIYEEHMKKAYGSFKNPFPRLAVQPYSTTAPNI